MTLLASVLSALIAILTAGDINLSNQIITVDEDIRSKHNQAAFHENDMMSAAQMGHCR